MAGRKCRRQEVGCGTHYELRKVRMYEQNYSSLWKREVRRDSKNFLVKSIFQIHLANTVLACICYFSKV